MLSRVQVVQRSLHLLQQRHPLSLGIPAAAGDFVMLADEVAPVIEALAGQNIEVVAVHNHMVHDTPRVFFLHFWGVGPMDALARGLKAGLAQTGAGAATP